MDGVKRVILENLASGSLSKQEALHALEALDTSTRGAPSQEEIAVVGMAGTAAMADDLEQFWDNMLNNRSCFVSKPAERITEERVWANPHYAELFGRRPHEDKDEDLERFVGAYLPSTMGFDENFFGISADDADAMDPQHRVFLQQAWRALEDAGYSDRTVRGSRTGVFVGRDGTNSNIYRRVVDTDDLGGIWEGILASRINYEYDLKGPAYVVDTACSSSIVAIHMAAQALRDDECSMAIAGGVCLTAGGLDQDSIDIGTIGERSPAPGSVVSSHFRVSAFDAKADGSVFGEGAAAIILKKLSDAERDGDHIYGVVVATATNSDGASNGLTAPNPRAQAALLRDVWDRAGINPEDIDYIEAHGTGTPLGDPIEVLGISNAFRQFTGRRQFCGIGSLKTNIGHTVGAAGVMSVIKVLLAMREEVIPASRNFQEPSSQIDFVDSPVYVVDRNTPWPRQNTARYAGASAFGFSGTNAHILLRDYPARRGEQGQGDSSRPRLFTVSAKTETAFENYLRRYEAYFAQDPQVPLKDLCFTASVGRDHFDYRLAIVVSSVDELAQKLALVRESGVGAGSGKDLSDKGVVVGRHRVVPDRTTVLEPGDIRASEWTRLNDDAAAKVAGTGQDATYLSLMEVARDYVRGADVDFSAFFDSGARRLPLPTYPFDLNVHWGRPRVTQIEPARTEVGDPVDAPVLRRLLVRTQDVSVYETTLDHTLWAITDHKMLGEYLVAGTVLIELIAEALRDYFGTDSLRLEEILFLAPLFVEETVPMTVQVIVQKERQDTVRVRIVSRRAGSSDEWVPKVTGRGRRHTEQAPPTVRPGAGLDVDDDLESHAVTVRNVEFGPRWKNLRRLWYSRRDPDTVYGYAELPEEYRGDPEHQGYILHPGLMDCTVSMVPFVTWLRPRVFLPLTYRDMTIYRPVPDAYYVMSQRLPGRSGELAGFKTLLFTELGEVIAEIGEFAMKRVTELHDFVSGSLSRLEWAERGRGALVPAAGRQGGVLVVGASPDVLAAVVAGAEGRRVVTMELAGTTERTGEDRFLVVPGEREIAATLDEIDVTTISDVLDFTSYAPWREQVSDEELDRGVRDDLNAHVALLKGLLARARPGTDVVVVVDHAHSVTGTERYIDASHTAKVAVAKSVRYEAPGIGLAVIDADGQTPLETLVAEALAQRSGPPMVALRDGSRFTARLVEDSLDELPEREVAIKGRKAGFYLVTGGLGSLGSVTALALSRHAGEPMLFVLSSRHNTLPPRAQWAAVRDGDPSSRLGHILTSLLDLTASGHTVLTVEMDVSDRNDVARVLDPIRDEHGPMLGVVHAAGLAGDGYLFTKSTDEFQRVLSPKVKGLRNLVAWAGAERPEFIVSYSSMASVVGGAGQSDYAAANAFLDGYSQQLRRQGYNALSINWPGWSEQGMAAEAGLGDGETFFEHLSTTSGVTAFMEFLSRDITGAIPSRPNLSMLARVGEDYFFFEFSDVLRRAVRRQLTKQEAVSGAPMSGGTLPLPEGREYIDVGAVSIMGKPDDQVSDVERRVALTFAVVLGIYEVHLDDTLTAMGGDSVAATELMQELNAHFNDVLSISDVFSYNSPAELAARIMELTESTVPMSPLPEPPAMTASRPTTGSGRHPADYDDMVDALERGDIDVASLRDFL